MALVGEATAHQNWEGRLWNGHSPSHGSSNNIKKCKVPHTPNKDDAPAIVKVFQDCNTNSEIIFQKNVAYNAWSPMLWSNLCKFRLRMPDTIDSLPYLANVVISIEGSIHLPNNITAVQQKVATNPNPPSVSPLFGHINALVLRPLIVVRHSMDLHPRIRCAAYRLLVGRWRIIPWLWSAMVGHWEPCKYPEFR